MIGEYIAKFMMEVKQRPQYIIDKKLISINNKNIGALYVFKNKTLLEITLFVYSYFLQESFL